MLVEKVLNNNVVVSIDPKTRKEVILMGSGIAFNKKAGQLIDERKIDHVCSAMLQFAGLHAAMPEVADGGRRGGGDHRDR